MDYQEFAQDIVRSAMRAGAHEAEVFLQVGSELALDVRMGQVETLTRASSKGVGLRVFVDKRMSFASTTDFEPDVIDDLVKTVVQLAKAASRDRHNGLPEEQPGVPVHLDLYDPAVENIPVERGIEMAKEAEKAAFDYDPRVTNSQGAGFGTHCGRKIIANSNGVLYEGSGTNCGISCAPVAEQDGTKQTGYHWTSRRFLDQLDPASDVGRQAAVDTVRLLGARKVETSKSPVIFDWRVGTVLIGAVFSALDGEDVHRGMSFLKKMLGKKVASPIVNIVDDPHMPGGLGSSPFDGEGVLTRRKTVVEEGKLKMYFYDSRTARKYGQTPTGNVRRGYSSTPSIGPYNFYLQPTDTPPEEIIRGVSDGFYVTQTMGRGANTVTGDFSVGASGLWIRDGEIAFPVQEVTVAGNMLDMLMGIEQIGNDAKFMSSMVTPTFKIAEMTISGR